MEENSISDIHGKIACHTMTLIFLHCQEHLLVGMALEVNDRRVIIVARGTRGVA